MRRVIAGRMRERVTIQHQRETNRTDGTKAKADWEDGQTVWASIKPKSGGEAFFLEKREERISHIISIRFGAKVKFGDRLVHRFRRRGEEETVTVYRIQRIINQGHMDRLLNIECLEGSTA